LRPHVDELRRKGAEVAVIGNGWPAMAKAFAQEMALPPGMRVLTDPKREAYRLAGFRHGLWSTLAPAAILDNLRARKKGFRQTKTAGDPLQQGGTLVIAPGGEILFRHASARQGDHPPPEQVVAAL